MNNLQKAYDAHSEELEDAILSVAKSGKYIMGEAVSTFARLLEAYTKSPYAIPCGNGTDALQLAMMGLQLKPGDEVLIPAFNYIAAAEAAMLLGLSPKFVDVSPSDFNAHAEHFEAAITPKTRALVAVHLYGQCSDMEGILKLAERHSLFVIEDTAQAFGSRYRFSDGSEKAAGTMGDVGTLSFFPAKNLGAMGDGGAMLATDKKLADRLRILTIHGQQTRYYFDVIGTNSRLDTMQAAILNVKLKYFDSEIKQRRLLAKRYLAAFEGVKELTLPHEQKNVFHTYNQFTVIVEGGHRNALREHLSKAGIATLVYYPESIDHHKAFAHLPINEKLVFSHSLPKKIVSIPLYPYLETKEQDHVIENVLDFFN